MADGSATDQNVKPLFDQLSAALTTAQSSLGSLKVQGLVTRQSQDEIAAVSADIVKVYLISRLLNEWTAQCLYFIRKLILLSHRSPSTSR